MLKCHNYGHFNIYEHNLISCPVKLELKESFMILKTELKTKSVIKKNLEKDLTCKIAETCNTAEKIMRNAVQTRHGSNAIPLHFV